MKNLTIYCDGACSGNPGRAGSGLALFYDWRAKGAQSLIIIGQQLF